jgi:hypothetical protein
MNCWCCGTELNWNADHDVEDSEEFVMVTHLSCPNCDAWVEFYTAKDKDDEQSD